MLKYQCPNDPIYNREFVVFAEEGNKYFNQKGKALKGTKVSEEPDPDEVMCRECGDSAIVDGE